MPTVSFENTETNPSHSTVTDVSPEEVLKNKEQLCLIDVRRPDEYTGELGHAPGASLITLDTLPHNMDQLPKNKTIVFLCRSGARSGNAAAHAQEKGWTDVYNMRGGMILWNQLGFSVDGKNS